MGKIITQKKSQRGIAICSKCGKMIQIGETYLKGQRYRCKPIVRCTQCGLKSYELSSSDYIRTVGSIKTTWSKKRWADQDDVYDLINKIESLRDDVESSLYSMPEQFQDQSILQDRLQSLEDCLFELNSIDIVEEEEDDDEEDDFEEVNYRTDIIGALSCL